MSIHPTAPGETPPAAQRRLPRPLWIGGVAVALAGGVFLGLAAQSDRGSVSAAKAEAAATPLQVELAGLPKTPQPVAGKLDVRPGGAAPAEQPAPPQIQPAHPDALERQTPPSVEDDGAEEIEVPEFEPQRLEPPPPEEEPLEDY